MAVTHMRVCGATATLSCPVRGAPIGAVIACVGVVEQSGGGQRGMLEQRCPIAGCECAVRVGRGAGDPGPVVGHE